MASTVMDLIHTHSANPVIETRRHTDSNKSWAKDFRPISRLLVRSVLEGDNAAFANFDGVLTPELADDTHRYNERVSPPSNRSYRLYSEADGVSWFDTEISNIVLAAFRGAPNVILQHQHPPKHSVTGSSSGIKLVDTAYTLKHGSTSHNLAIGEFKRNLINPREWQGGRLSRQKALSQELFRVNTVEELKQDCEVDCWVFPRNNFDGTPLRYAFYRLLVQGFRRCQTLHRVDPHFGGQLASHVSLYSGIPFWRAVDGYTSEPYGYSRTVDPETGAWYWVDENGNTLFDANGQRIWDSEAFWA